MNLVVLSHRGPIVHSFADSGITATRSGGGLATALRDLTQYAPSVHWICAADTDADRVVARQGTVPLGGARGCRVEMLDIDPDAHHGFYGIIANPILWYIQHYLWDHVRHPEITASERRAWSEGYRVVNRRFADAAVARAGASRDAWADTLVVVHDYHFYLVPAMVREQAPGAFIQFFVHIPWPQPDAWRILPLEMRTELLEGLLGSDLVSFHTERFARNFLLTCQELLGLDVDFGRMEVQWQGRSIAVRHYPISVDEATLRTLADAPAVERFEQEVAALCGDAPYLIARVDRTDPSKNIVRGFRAFDLLLGRHPELVGRVTFIAHLQPSRQDVEEYCTYLEHVIATVSEVNMRHATDTWTPIILRIEHNIPLAVALYRRFDLLLVNSIFDGMNLVAKEAIVLSERHGVLALSENTGAHEELGAVAITLHPYDLEQQADAMWRGLTMPEPERIARHEAALDIVRTNNVRKWFDRQMADVETLRNAQRAASGPTADAIRFRSAS